MYLFDSDTIREDMTYDGGRDRLELVMTQKRELPPRAAATEISAPTITLKLSKKAIEELQLLDPVKLAKLVDIIDAVTGRGAPQKPQAPPQSIPPQVPIPQPHCLRHRLPSQERERRSGNGLQHNSVNQRKCCRPVGHGKRCVNASPPVFQICSSGSRDYKIM